MRSRPAASRRSSLITARFPNHEAAACLAHARITAEAAVAQGKTGAYQWRRRAAYKFDFGHFEEESFIDQWLSETSSLRLSRSASSRIRQMAKVEIRPGD
jgi:hypothetical protein